MYFSFDFDDVLNRDKFMEANSGSRFTMMAKVHDCSWSMNGGGTT